MSTVTDTDQFVKWSRNYTELPKGWYSAEVREHMWEGWFVFRAYPDSGDVCVEYMTQNVDDAIGCADAWVEMVFGRGSGPVGLYSSNY